MRCSVFCATASAAAAALTLVGCSGDLTPQPTLAPRVTSVPVTLPGGVAPQPFNVGVAVPGAADPHDAQFVADQQGLYDATQLSDTSIYPIGYHWRIDPGIGPHGVVSAQPVVDPQSGQWAITIHFSNAAASRWGADTQAAFQAGQGSPQNRIAIFIGNRVVSAPGVISPSSTDTEITGNFTQAQAAAICAAILAAATS
jgi:hypothetical protein